MRRIPILVVPIALGLMTRVNAWQRLNLGRLEVKLTPAALRSSPATPRPRS